MKKNEGIYIIIANVLNLLIQLSIVYFLNNDGNLIILGKYTLILSVVAPFSLFINFKLKNYVISHPTEELDILKFRYSTLFIFNIFIIGIVTLLFCMNFYLIDEFVMMLLVILIKSFDTKSDLINGIIQNNKGIKVAGILLLKKNLSIFMLIVPIFMITQNLYYVLSSWLIINVYFYFFIEKTYIYDSTKTFTLIDQLTKNKTFIYSLLILFLPVGISQLFISISANFPRYVLGIYSGPKDVAVYSTLIYASIALNVIAMTLQQIETGKIINEIKKTHALLKIFNHDLKKIILILIISFICLSISFYLFIPFILGDIYKDYIFEFLMILLGTLFIYFGWYCDIFFTIEKQLKFLKIGEYVRFLSLLIFFGLSIVFFNELTIRLIAIITCLSSIMIAAYKFVQIKKLLKGKY